MADLTPAHELRAHARRTRMPSSCLRVYDALLDRRGENATAWPSVARLMEDTGCKERTVQDALRALERHGWLSRVDTGRRATEYQLLAGEAIAHIIGSRQRRDEYLAKFAPQGANRRTHGCEPSHPRVRSFARGGCEPSHPNYPLELSSELSREPHHAGDVCAPERSSPVAPPPLPPAPKPGECVHPRSEGRPNLAVIATRAMAEAPDPDEMPDVEVPDRLSPGSVLRLPGTLDELFADLLGNGHAIVRSLRLNGVSSTADLFACVADETARYTRGLGPIRAQRMRLHLAERWGVTLSAEADLEAGIVGAVSENHRRRQPAPALRAVHDGGHKR